MQEQKTFSKKEGLILTIVFTFFVGATLIGLLLGTGVVEKETRSESNNELGTSIDKEGIKEAKVDRPKVEEKPYDELSFEEKWKMYTVKDKEYKSALENEDNGKLQEELDYWFENKYTGQVVEFKKLYEVEPELGKAIVKAIEELPEEIKADNDNILNSKRTNVFTLTSALTYKGEFVSGISIRLYYEQRNFDPFSSVTAIGKRENGIWKIYFETDSYYEVLKEEYINFQ